MRVPVRRRRGSAGNTVIDLLSGSGESDYKLDAEAALAAAGTAPGSDGSGGSGALGEAAAAIDQANAALSSAQEAQGNASDAVSAYGGLGGDVLEPNNELVVLAGQIQDAIDDLEAASAQYSQLQAYAQTWAMHLALGVNIADIQAGITAAQANAVAAQAAAADAQASAEEARQYADDAATAAVPPGNNGL